MLPESRVTSSVVFTLHTFFIVFFLIVERGTFAINRWEVLRSAEGLLITTIQP